MASNENIELLLDEISTLINSGIYMPEYIEDIADENILSIKTTLQNITDSVDIFEAFNATIQQYCNYELLIKTNLNQLELYLGNSENFNDDTSKLTSLHFDMFNTIESYKNIVESNNFKSVDVKEKFSLVEGRVKRLVNIVKSISDLIKNIKQDVFKSRSEYVSTFINSKLLTRPMVKKLIEDQYLTNNSVMINLSEYFIESSANILKYQVVLDIYNNASIVVDQNNVSFLKIKGAYRATSYNIHLKVINKSVIFNTNYSSINPNTTLNSTNIDTDLKYSIQSIVKVYEDSSPAIPIQPESVVEINTSDLIRINLMDYFSVIGDQTIERYILHEQLDNVTIVDDWLEIQGFNRDITYQIFVRAVDNLNKESDNLIFDIIETISVPNIGAIPTEPINVIEVYELDLSTIFTHPTNDLVYSYGPFDIPNVNVSITGSLLRITATYDNATYAIPVTATTLYANTRNKSSTISINFKNRPSVPSLKIGIDATIIIDTFEINNSFKSMNNFFESTGEMTFLFNLVEQEYEDLNLYTTTSSTIKFMQLFRGITYNVNVTASNDSGTASLTFQVTEYPLQEPNGNGFDSAYNSNTYYDLYNTPLVLSDYFTGYNINFETKTVLPLVYSISRVHYIANENETDILDHSFEIIENKLYFGNNTFNNRDTYIEITAENTTFNNILQSYKQTLLLRENVVLPLYSFEGSSVFNYVNQEGNRAYIIYNHSIINSIDLSLVASGPDLSYALSGPDDKIGNNITLTDSIINFSESYGNSVYDIQVSVSNYRFDGLKNTTSFTITLYENIYTPSKNQLYIETIPYTKLHNDLIHVYIDEFYTVSLNDLINNTITRFDVKFYKERDLINEINDPTIYRFDMVNNTLTLNRKYLNRSYYVNITAVNVNSWDPNDPYLLFVYNGDKTLITTIKTSYILNVIDDIKVPKFVNNFVTPWKNYITLTNNFYNINLLNYFTGDDIDFNLSIEYTSSYATSNIILTGGNASIIGNYRNNTYIVTFRATNTNFNGDIYSVDSYVNVLEEEAIQGEVIDASLIINDFIVNSVIGTMANTVYKDTSFTVSLYGMFINYTSLSAIVVDGTSQDSQSLFNNSNIELIGETLNVSVNYRNMLYYIRVIVDQVNIFHFPVNETIRIPKLISNLEFINTPMLPIDESTMDYSIDLNNHFTGDQLQFELIVIDEDRVTILNNDNNSIVGVENMVMTIHSNYRNNLYFIKVIAFNVDHNNGEPNVTEPTYLTIRESRLTIQEELIQNLIVAKSLTYNSIYVVNLTQMFIDNVPDDFSYKILDSEKVVLLSSNIIHELYKDENNEWILKLNSDYRNKKYYVRVFASYTTENHISNDIYVDFEFIESIRPPYTLSDDIFEITLPNGGTEGIDLHQYIDGQSITYEILSVTLDGVETPNSYYISNDALYLENTYTESNEVLVTIRGSNQDFLGNTFNVNYIFKVININLMQNPEGSTNIENIKKTYNLQRLLGNTFGNFSVFTNNDGSVYTIGSNTFGQLGNNTFGNNYVTRQIPNILDVITVQGGEYHSVALKSNGRVFTWGANSNGQLGDSTTINKSVPVLVPSISSIVSIACGSKHTLALDSKGNVHAWGANNDGQLGDGTKVDKSAPVLVQGLVNIVHIACGYYNSIAVDSSGIPYIWGDISFGQIASDETVLVNPVVVEGIANVKSVAAGNIHVAFLQSSGNVYTLGGNTNGQLGNGTTTNSSSVTLVPDLSNVVQVACGMNHTVALDYFGNVYTWGLNAYGQIVSSPEQVTNVSNIVSIACGYDNTKALDLSGNVYLWGYNNSGQLGNGLIDANIFNPLISSVIGKLFPISILQSTNPILLKDESKIFKLANYFDGYKRSYTWSVDTYSDVVDISIVTNMFNDSLLIINSEFRNINYNITVTASPFDDNPSIESVSYVFAIVEVVPPPFLKNNGFEKLSKIFSYSAETLTYNVSEYFGGYDRISIKQVINVNTQAIMQYNSSWITLENGILSVYTLNRNMDYNIVVLAQRLTTINSVEYVFETVSILRISENSKPVTFKLV